MQSVKTTIAALKHDFRVSNAVAGFYTAAVVASEIYLLHALHTLHCFPFELARKMRAQRFSTDRRNKSKKSSQLLLRTVAATDRPTASAGIILLAAIRSLAVYTVSVVLGQTSLHERCMQLRNKLRTSPSVAFSPPSCTSRVTRSPCKEKRSLHNWRDVIQRATCSF